MYAVVKMNRVEYRFECDFESKVTIINDEEFKRLKLNILLQKTNEI